MPETVSIVIPTFDRAAYLQETLAAVERVAEQDGVEVIVVDDGSTDETPDVVGAARSVGRYLHRPHRGLAAARNAGLAAAEGTYVTFLDSDDLITADKMRVQVPVLDADRSLIGVYSRWGFIDAASVPLVEADGEDFSHDIVGALSISNFAPIHAYLLRTEAVREVGGFAVDLRGRGYEDWDLFGRLALAGGRFAFVPEVTAQYRMHGGNMTSAQADALCVCGLDVISRFAATGRFPTDRLRLATALVYMEACSQIYRRGAPQVAARYGAAALNAYPHVVRHEMFFHYLVTFAAPAEIGYAAFVLYRSRTKGLLALHRQLCADWTCRTGAAYELAVSSDAEQCLEAWAAGD